MKVAVYDVKAGIWFYPFVFSLDLSGYSCIPVVEKSEEKMCYTCKIIKETIEKYER